MFSNNNSGLGAGVGTSLKVQPKKTCTITYNYQSTLLTGGGIFTLPTTEPVTPQMSYTIAQNMFPTLKGDLPRGIDYVGFLLAGCINNNTSSARTLNWRVLKNGTSIATGSQSVVASNKATLNFDSMSGANKPVVDDVWTVSLWCTESDTDMQFNRYGLGIHPVRIKPVNDPSKMLMFLSVNASNGSAVTNFTQNYGGSFGVTRMTIWTNPNDTIVFYSGTFSINGAFENSTYGVVTNVIDTAPANNVIVHASNYVNNTIQSTFSVSWRETNIRYSGQ